MSDTRETVTVSNSNLTKFVSNLAMAINTTYSYASGSSIFCAMAPAYMKDWSYRYLMPCCRWLDGYVPELHDGNSGIISTRIADALISGTTRQIVGEKVVFKIADVHDERAKETLSFISEKAKKNRWIKGIFSSIGFALGCGTSYIKTNKTSEQEIWWEGVRFDNGFVLSDFKGDVQEATFLIRNYTDSRKGKSHQQFFLTEHRFYKRTDAKIEMKGDSFEVKSKKNAKVPMVEYAVYRTNGTVFNNTMASTSLNSSIKWDELPKFIRDAIHNDYGSIRVGEPQELGFINLGVEMVTNGYIDLSVPTAQTLGKSLIIDCIGDFITYEYAYSCRIRDMYLGKGAVYTPKQLTMSDIGNAEGIEVAKGGVLSSMPDTPIEVMPGVDPESQKAIVQQFDLRAEEWQKIIDDSLKAVATKWGMSPKIIASYLSQGTAQQTATQIDSEDDITIAFINTERSYFKESLNRLLETTLNFYGRPTNISLEFSSPSVVNKDRLLQRTQTMLDMGLIDIEEAVRIMNPDLEEDALQSKIQKAIGLYNEKKNEMQSGFDEFGDFDVGKNDGNLDGTSKPQLQ